MEDLLCAGPLGFPLGVKKNLPHFTDKEPSSDKTQPLLLNHEGGLS